MNIPENVTILEQRVRLADRASTPKGSDRTGEIADWVVANIPWTVAVPDWPEFHDRWPLLSHAELTAVEVELRRRCLAIETAGTDLETISESLPGRTTYWTAAADWLILNPCSTVADPEFVRLFSQLSRAELILAAVEHKRRVLNGRHT
ncbi:hypothetical protein [Sphingopyxis sp. R3-92]|uniref:hypothetical protein n=1 Tax=Sphingopyxis sp. R3-92 TaxID=3158553 RepID=UPI003EE50F1F